MQRVMDEDQRTGTLFQILTAIYYDAEVKKVANKTIKATRKARRAKKLRQSQSVPKA